MDILIDIFKLVVPTIITGIITFLVTRYSYNRNIPTKNLEIAYDRVYYPIYRMIKDEVNKDLILDNCCHYLRKYEKYVDKSTIIAFQNFKRNVNNKKAFTVFSNNIYNTNTKLRRQLGYLEPNMLSMYKYMAPSEKRTLKIGIEIIVCYIAVMAETVLPEGIIKEALLWVIVFSFMAFLINLFIIFAVGVIKRICNLKKFILKPMTLFESWSNRVKTKIRLRN